MSLHKPLTPCLLLCFAMARAGMLADCVALGMVFPSLESFLQRWRMPKTHFMFYEYLYKAVVTESVWKERLNAPGNDARLGTVISEAYALAELDNQYYSWMYQFIVENPNSTLVTEYDQREDQGGSGNANDQQETEEDDLFCGALVSSDCEISVPVTSAATVNATTSNDFKILLSSTSDPAAYKAAKDHAQEISKDIKAKIESDRRGNGNDGRYTRLDSYKKMEKTLEQDLPMINQENIANAKKRKRKSKSGMTAYTSSTRKSKKGSDKNAGWSAEGKKLVCELFKEIKQDEESGIRKKWENVYKQMYEATKQDKAKAVDDNDEIEAPFEMDVNMLYMEV